MGTIGNALSGYYQLSNLLSSGSGSSSSAASNPIDSLLQNLFSSGSGSSSSNNDAFTLDLSPQAQQLLGSSSSTSTSANGSSTNFTLTATQKTAIENILEKYKDAPLTQATFTEIQNDLQSAGLSPQTLGAEDQIKSFNPTSVLMQALSGDYSGLTDPSQTATNEQTKESNYMKSIVSLWKSMDTSASSASGSSGAGTVSSSSGASL